MRQTIEKIKQGGLLLLLMMAISSYGQVEKKNIYYKHHIIDLEGLKVGTPSRFVGYSTMAVSPSGNSAYVAWNESERIDDKYCAGDLHITPLNAGFERSGKDLVLTGLVINDILVTDEKSITLLAGKVRNNTYLSNYPNELYVVKIDLYGNVLWETRIAGGDGHGPQAQWPDYSVGDINLHFNGEEYAAFFSLMKNWAKRGEEDNIHQGDKFVVLSKDGVLQDDKTQTWKSSHSNILYLSNNEENEFTTLNTGDGYPFGVVYTNRDKNKASIIWPPEGFREGDDITWVGTAGRSGGMVHKNGLAYLLINTDKTDKLLNGNEKNKDDNALLLLKLDNEGNILREYWLDQKLCNGGEGKIQPYGNGFIIVNANNIEYDANAPFGSSFNPNAVVRVVSNSGVSIIEPVELLRSSFGSNLNLISLPNGGVAWSTVRYKNQTQIEITEILPPGAYNGSSINASDDTKEIIKKDNYAGVINFLQPLENQKFNGKITLNENRITNEGLSSTGMEDKGIRISYTDFDYEKFSIEAKFKYDTPKLMPVFELSSFCRLMAFYINLDGEVELRVNNGDVKMKTGTYCTKSEWHTAKIEYKEGAAYIYLDDDLLGIKKVVLNESCAAGNNADISLRNHGNWDKFNGVIETIIIK